MIKSVGKIVVAHDSWKNEVEDELFFIMHIYPYVFGCVIRIANTYPIK